MGKVFPFVIVSVMSLCFPYLCKMSLISNSDVVPPGLMEINDLIGAISYMTAIAFILKSVLVFQQVIDKDKSNQTVELSKQTVDKEKEIITIDTKDVTDTPINLLSQLNFENKELNKKLSDIENVIQSIMSLPTLQNNENNKSLVYSAQETYVKKVYEAYIVIPKELRDKKVNNCTANVLAMEQLIVLENGLREIENDLLSEQLKDLNIMSRFLQEKFPEKKQYLTVMNK